MLNDVVHNSARQGWNGVSTDAFGRRLDTLECESIRMLHSRWVPGTKSFLDHIVVTTNGVHVIVVCRAKGRPMRSVGSQLFRRRTESLLIGNRERTKYIRRAQEQREVVRLAVDDETVPVRGVLCLSRAEWSEQKPLVVGGVEVLWLQRLMSQLQADGPLSDARIAAVHRRLDREFLPK